jgi:hypothetical protein
MNDKTIVVLPEHIGTWLMLAGEKNELYQALHKDAMNWLAVSNPCCSCAPGSAPPATIGPTTPTCA